LQIIPAASLPASGEVTHTYNAAADVTISVDLVDEDGIFEAVDIKDLSIVESLLLGDAPDGSTQRDKRLWRGNWTDKNVDITHRADYSDPAESWTRVKLNDKRPDYLRQGDIYTGDLGVSGQALATGSVPQEIEGTEALRFQLDDPATLVTLDLTLFYANDDGNGNAESVRIQAFDLDGNQVAEVVSSASNSEGTASIQLEATEGFTALVVTSGVYDGADFVFGGLADETGILGQAPLIGTGSDFLIQSIEFAFGQVTPPPVPLALEADVAMRSIFSAGFQELLIDFGTIDLDLTDEYYQV
jgi:hypothetical protein